VVAFTALAFSRRTRRRSFPLRDLSGHTFSEAVHGTHLGFFGMSFTNCTPPARCLYAIFTSATCRTSAALIRAASAGSACTRATAGAERTTNAIGTSPLYVSGALCMRVSISARTSAAPHAPDDARVPDVRVREEVALELRRRDLEAADFDELLDAVVDPDPVVGVDARLVPCADKLH
jgi:hypothetical protein